MSPYLRRVAGLCALALPCLAQDEWTLQLPAPGATLRGLHVQSALVARTAGGEGVVRQTADGGLTWQDHQLPTDRLDAVRFQGSAVGLAVGDGVFRTTNGGSTWALVDGAAGLHDVVFLSSSIALACGDGGTILRSVDGGATWSALGLPTAEPLLALSFQSSSAGLVVGAGGVAFRSTDAGASWQPLNTGSAATLTDVDLIGGDEGWVCAGIALLHTTDLGQTWQVLPLPAGVESLGVDFLTSGTGWVAGHGEVVVRTTDGGQTWASGLAGGGGALRCVGFADFSKGLAVGDGGAIWSSSDGGQSWTQVGGGVQDAPPYLTGFDAVDPLHAWATGGFGEVHSTDDGGQTWSASVVDPLAVYEDIDFHDGLFGTVGGRRQGTFPAFGWTTDGGATWNFNYLVAQFGVHTAESFGPGRALVAGSSWVLRTTDTWQTFTLEAPSPSGTYHGSDSIGDTIWLVGTKFHRSTDGGATWQFVHDPGPTFRDVSFADLQNGWAVGDGSAVLRTTDGGLTWQPVSPPAGARSLTAVSASAPSTVWVAGPGGYAASTTDGGASWSLEPLPEPNDVTSLKAFDASDAWLGGGEFAQGGRVWRFGGDSSCGVESYCTAKTNSLGGACHLSASGTPAVGSTDFVLHAQGAVPGQFGLFFHGDAGAASLPFHGGTLCVAPPLVRLPVLQTDSAGAASWSVDVPAELAGTSRWYQFWFRDPAHPDGTGAGLSDGLRVDFCP